MPELTPIEYEALKADIQESGVLVPVEVDENGEILDGHHRVRAWQELRADGVELPTYPKMVRQGMTEEQKRNHARKLNIMRRHLDAAQRAEVMQSMRADGMSLRQIAEATGASVGTVHKDTAGVQNRTPARVNGKDGKSYPAEQKPKPKAAPPATLFVPGESESLDPKAVHQQVAAEKVQKKEEKKDRQQEQRRAAAEVANGAEVSELVRVQHGNFVDLGATIADNSVDFIFTDPPYDDKSVPMYGDLAVLAARVLKPGGSLITYVGHHALPAVLPLMTPHLRFWWTLAVHHNGSAAHFIGKNVFVHWKPMLWFVKDRRRDGEYVADYIESSPPDKVLHDWQQDTSEAAYYIEHLTAPGELVLDPFCGSGTTLLAALTLGRQSIGIEIDEERAQVARGRIIEYSQSA